MATYDFFKKAPRFSRGSLYSISKNYQGVHTQIFRI